MNKKYNYKNIKIYESFVPPVTLNMPQWRNYISNGYNTLYGDSIIPGDSEMDGAVYSGHVKQNPMTAMYPYNNIQNSY